MLQIFKCSRCTHEWASKGNPKKCPKCQSIHWAHTGEVKRGRPKKKSPPDKGGPSTSPPLKAGVSLIRYE